MSTARRGRARTVRLGPLSLAFVLAVGFVVVPADGRGLVVVATVEDDTINPITARFLVRAIDHAEQRDAACFVILLDTPGGLVDSTRDITKRILDSSIPVVVYVAPSGGRAASAGLFITLAAHAAAMAPGTNIGAAHPVQVGGWPFSPQSPPAQPVDDESKPQETESSRSASPAEDKALRDTAAWARALAELRGRNVEWAGRAVIESASATATEAAGLGVIEVVATDLADLLHWSDGRDVPVAGTMVTLQVSDSERETIRMWWGERLLSAIASPNLAFLLLMFGFYGILLELYSPGWGVGGTVGVICLVLAFFALAVLPVNHVGLALLSIGLALFVAEAFVTSYGFLALGGVVSMTLGGLMLVDSPAGFLRISPLVVVPVALATAVITVFLVGQVIRAHRQPAMTGTDGLLRERAVADETFISQNGSYAGVVRVHGELWRAVCPAPISAGQTVTIAGRDGLLLQVSSAGSSLTLFEGVGMVYQKKDDCHEHLHTGSVALNPTQRAEASIIVRNSCDVVAEQRWSFPHDLALTVRVFEKGQTVLSIECSTGLTGDEQDRKASNPHLSDTTDARVAAIQDPLSADLPTRHEYRAPASAELEAGSIPRRLGTRIRLMLRAAGRTFCAPLGYCRTLTRREPRRTREFCPDEAKCASSLQSPAFKCRTSARP